MVQNTITREIIEKMSILKNRTVFVISTLFLNEGVRT